jgi:NAD(P)H-dependent flavin oxidoreductase YrpB (nitropropane dioxygenase family)
VFTDPIASPTGFPFKVVVTGAPEPERERVCDLGYLRVAYQREDESIGWRCPAEPVDQYVRKGGAIEDTEGRKCLCNALMANIGLGQVRDEGVVEPPILTAGDDLDSIRRFLPAGASSYTAADVIAGLLTGADSPGLAADS